MTHDAPPIQAVYTSDNRRECREFALVLAAIGMEYHVHREGRRYAILVAAENAEAARAELAAYAQETRERPADAVDRPHTDNGVAGVVGYATVLMAVGALANVDAFGADWIAAGKTHAGAMRHGQWWRAITALTLHSDLLHLASNLVFGGVVGLFAGQMLGSGPAWLGILVAGAAGNMLLALVRPAGYTSIGASTSVFAALGLVAAYAWATRRQDRGPKLRRGAPIVAAVLLLAYLGTGGERVDVPAHLSGFACGVALGAGLGKLGGRIKVTAQQQAALGPIALVILASAWWLALTST